MALLELVIYPHPILLKTAEVVTDFDESLEKLVEDMAETMYAGKGVGLAAPQVAKSLQLFIIDTSEQDAPKELQVFINPRIIKQSSPTVWNEGCLSLPGLFKDVDTYAEVEIEALDIKGKKFRTTAKGLKAVAILHEYGHLYGEIFIDRLSPIKKRMVQKYWTKQRKKLAKEVYDQLGVPYVLTP